MIPDSSSTGITVAASAVDLLRGFWIFPNVVDAADKQFTITASVDFGDLSLGSRTTATVIIRDDDPTVVSLARVGNGAVSEGGRVEFTVSLGRALIAGETIDVPLAVGGTGVTTADWNLARKTGTGLNTGVTLSGESTVTPNVRFSGAGAQTATLELTPLVDNVVENAETFTIALGPDGAGTNGFDHTSLGTNVGGGADPHGTNKSFSVVVNSVEPAKPTGFSATAGNAQVTLAWSDPNNSDITGWQYRQKAGSGNYGSWTTISGSSASTTSHTVSGLSNGTAYTFRIRAVAGSVNGAQSDEATATPQNVAPPSKPTGFSATAGNGEVSLAWSDPDNSDITRWQYRQKAGSGNYGSWTTISGSSASTTSHTVTGGLTNGTAYTFRIRAVAGTVNGAQSDEATATPSATPPSVVITESGSGTTVAEYTDGTQLTDSYEVKLATQPTHDVTVTATLPLGSGARVRKSGGSVGRTVTLSFSPSGSTIWSTAQTITVSGQRDDVDNVGDARSTTISHAATSTDPKYAIANAGTVTVSITDDDTAGVRLSESERTVGEAGGTSTWTVVLDSEPTHSVTVTVTSGDGAVAQVDGPDGGTAFTNSDTLSFTAGNWDSPQTVTVEGQDDDVDNANNQRSTSISHGATSTDPKYVISNAGSVTVTVTDDDEPNSAPVFGQDTLTRSVAENSGTGVNVGAVIPAATDVDNDVLTYTLEGTDAGSFTFNAATRQISTKAGESYDHEGKNSYAVSVKVEDGNGGSDTVAVTISVTDEAEPPSAPAAPTVSATADSTTELEVSWTAPSNTGKPAIASYDVQYREGSSGEWRNGPQEVTGTSSSLSGLASGTAYQVRVRASNAEGDGGWSSSGSGTTNSPSNTAPVFADPTPTRSVVENSGAGVNVGGVVTATDEDGDSLTYTLGGTDAGAFVLDSASGQISTKAGVRYDHEGKSSYSVTVTADDGNGGRSSVTVSITVTDADEPPSAPAAPRVRATAGSTTELEVSWTAPSNTGKPAIASYDVQYREGSSGEWRNGPQEVTGTSSSLTGLSPGTAYEVRVRGTNAEGDGGWSSSGRGTTTANSAPTVANPIPERTATVDTLFRYIFPSSTFADADGDPLSYTARQGDGTALPTWLRFTAGSRTFSGRPTTAGRVTVRVTATDGHGGTVSDDFNIVVSAGSGGSGGGGGDGDRTPPPPSNVPVVRISGGPAISEGGTAVFTLTASPAPTEAITVNLTVAESGRFAAPGQTGTRSITIGIDGAARFTVATVADSMAEADGGISATVAAGSGYSPAPAHGGATVVVADARLPEDLPPADLLLSPTGLSSSASLTVDRGGSSSYTIALSRPLSAGAVVTVSIRAEGSAITIEPAEVTFTAADWNLPQRVRVTASESGGGSSSLSHRATGGGYDNAEATLTVRVPAATAGVTLSSRSVSVSAAPGAGRTDTYTVVLDSQPTHNVTITVTSGLPAAVLVSGPGGAAGTSAILTFTPATWATPQQVTVTGVEDNLEQSSSRTVTITHRAASDDGDYDNISIAPVTVTAPVVAAADVAVQQGWLTRLGRTVSQQVVDALQQRFSAQPAPGVHLTVDGAAISSAVPLQENQQVLSKALGFERSSSQQVVEGSAFSFSPQATAEAGGAPRLALWGRGALSSFHGQQNTVSFDGEVSTALVGAEWRAERWQAGAALSHSWGNGSYGAEGDHSAQVDSRSSLTGIFPYGRYGLTPRLGVWAVAGHGWGQLSLQPDGAAREYEANTNLRLAAIGLDGLLRQGGDAGISVTTTTDVLMVHTTSAAVEGLKASEGSVSRLRLGLAATRPFPLANGAALLPSLELGMRQDGGDAETGFGLEVGAGLTWEDPQHGISAQVRGRTLLTHADEELREQGLAFSLAWDPDPSNRGPSFSLSHSLGAVAAGGMDALLSPVAMQVLDGPGNRQQFAAEAAYGFPAYNNRLTLTPALVLALSPHSSTYSLLWTLAPYDQLDQGEPWELSLQAERQEHGSSPSPTAHSLKLRFSLLF